jgi:hypothetical protein
MTTARFTPGPSLRASALLTLALSLAAGVTSVGAQQRVDVSTTTRRARDEGDSSEREVRRLKQRADSLAHLYGDNDDLSAADRQRVGEALDRTVDDLERALRTANGGGSSTAALRVQVAPLRNRRAAQAMSRALMQQQTADTGPHGWVGLVVNGVAREPRIENGELIVHYITYPEVLSVEPSSPAERAGIMPGDTLIAYDGRDVRDIDVSMTRLLTPNARVMVRIARDGRMRDFPLTVADAPSRILLRRDDMNGTLSVGRAPGTIAMLPAFPSSPIVPLPPTPMRHSMVGSAAPAAAALAPVALGGLAGAQMGGITRAWARMTGVAHGVLVMRAPSGSLAAESGLRDADVIVKAAGQSVRTLPELRDLIATAWGAGARSIAIEFVRERKTRTGALRW